MIFSLRDLMDIRVPRGLRERRPEEAYKLLETIRRLRELFESYGYLLYITPTYEHSDLFILRSGEEIRERMFLFRSKDGEKEYALRPEVTAQIARSVALGKINYPRPIRLYYFSNVFRYERPQRGRYREFRQAGIEIIGSESVLADAESIKLLEDSALALGVEDFVIGINDVSVIKEFLKKFVPERHISSVLTAIDRVKSLKRRGHETTVEEELRKRGVEIDISKLEELLSLSDPTELSSLGLESKRLIEVFEALEEMGAKKYKFDPTIVRGLEYYTSIVYEMDVPRLGGASQVAGGGRYDTLIEEFGGPREACVGFAIGLDRLIEASSIEASPPRPDIYVIPLERKFLSEVLSLRDRFRVVLDVSGRKLKKSLSRASSLGARYVIIIGKREASEGKVVVKDMLEGKQYLVEVKSLRSFFVRVFIE